VGLAAVLYIHHPDPASSHLVPSIHCQDQSHISKSMTTTRAPDYVNGLITNWIPLTTPGPGSLLGECSSAIYVVPGSNTELVAFDPYYGHFIDTAVQCLATQQSLWWNQHSDGVTTDINLGPFNCPTGYTTASASTVNSQTTFVGCCPSYVPDT